MKRQDLLDLLRDVAELRHRTPSAIEHAIGQRAAVLLNELRRAGGDFAPSRRPRFARLKAPARPVLDEVGPAPTQAEYEAVRAIGDGEPTAELLIALTTSLPSNCEPYTCAGCGHEGIWHRGLLTPPAGREPKRFCRACKENHTDQLQTQRRECTRCLTTPTGQRQPCIEHCSRCTTELPCLNHF